LVAVRISGSCRVPRRRRDHDASPRANAFFENLDRANRYAILFRIQTAKKRETRKRNIQKFIVMLERHEKIHP